MKRCREPAGAPPLYVARRATGAGVTKQRRRDEARHNRRRARAPPHAIRGSRLAAGRHGRAPDEGGTPRCRQRHSEVSSEALRGVVRGTPRFRQRHSEVTSEALRGVVSGSEATCASSSHNSSMASAGPRSVHASVCSGAAVTCAGGAPCMSASFTPSGSGFVKPKVHAGAPAVWLYAWATASVLSSSISRSVVPGRRVVPG
ncbi:hypothetical protein Ctob_012251 [Chrysochromulina tobinii]|uniref:Uncharacterized protein n=1 Tax=Chrysochromulina tobinii TaxID=1460289 RepID=A0A0M0LQ92_9EUKA|nr:hypothetical protein Ctob_012251 [Chrysochromulina tobinii]|eukprot:KOO53235.1 hypothetical protein Ctob_012251 [Chrysochromulina sp. CCMP291]